MKEERRQIRNLIAEIFGNEIQRKAMEKLIFLVMNLMNKEKKDDNNKTGKRKPR